MIFIQPLPEDLRGLTVPTSPHMSPGECTISHVCDVNVHMSVQESADSANQKCAMSNVKWEFYTH